MAKLVHMLWVKFHGEVLGKGRRPLGEVEHAIGCGMLPTLAGQVGLRGLTGQLIPNQLDLPGLVQDPKGLGKQLPFQVVHV